MGFNMSAASHALMRNAGLVIRESAGGISVYGDDKSKAAINALQIEADAQETSIAKTVSLKAGDSSAGDIETPSQPSLTFKLVSKDALFSNYTHVEKQSGETLPYLSNLSLNRVDSNRADEVLWLHQGEGVAQQDLVAADSPRLDGVLNRKERWVKPVAVVRIELAKKIGFDFSSNDWIGKEYQIQFLSPSRYWMYCIYGVAQDSQLEVSDPINEYVFDYLGFKSLDHSNSSGAAHLFKSQQRISLRKRSPYRFQLNRTSDFGTQMLINPLPCAQCHEMFVGDGAAQEEIYAPIYLNV